MKDVFPLLRAQQDRNDFSGKPALHREIEISLKKHFSLVFR